MLRVAGRTVWGAEPEEMSLLHALFYMRSAGGLDVLLDVEGGAQQDRIVGGIRSCSPASWPSGSVSAVELGDSPVDAGDRGRDGGHDRVPGRPRAARRAARSSPFRRRLRARIDFGAARPSSARRGARAARAVWSSAPPSTPSRSGAPTASAASRSATSGRSASPSTTRRLGGARASCSASSAAPRRGASASAPRRERREAVLACFARIFGAAGGGARALPRAGLGPRALERRRADVRDRPGALERGRPGARDAAGRDPLRGDRDRDPLGRASSTAPSAPASAACGSDDLLAASPLVASPSSSSRQR